MIKISCTCVNLFLIITMNINIIFDNKRLNIVQKLSWTLYFYKCSKNWIESLYIYGRLRAIYFKQVKKYLIWGGKKYISLRLPLNVKENKSKVYHDSIFIKGHLTIIILYSIDMRHQKGRKYEDST